MNTVVVATSEADSAAVEAVRQHHAELAGALAAHTEALLSAAAQGDASAAGSARHTLVSWCQRDLLPHALAEEQAMYPLAREDERARLLVEAMLAEHRVITGLVAAVRDGRTPVHAAASAQALRVVFDSHLAKEDDQILPLLAAAPQVSLQEVLGGMHELLGHAAGHEHADERHGGCGGSCSCGESDPVGVFPELDARVVPHAIRHATIFGALDAVKPGGGLVLIAPHDPIPLLQQVEQRAPRAFSVEYLERGPEAWRIAFTRS